MQGRQKVPCGEYVFVRMESGATCGLPAWMLSAACATFVLGAPPIATDALLELAHSAERLAIRPAMR